MELTIEQVEKELSLIDDYQTLFGSLSKVGLQLAVGERIFRVVSEGKIIYQGVDIRRAVEYFNTASEVRV